MPGTRIAAVGHHQPEHVLTNDDLARMVDTDDAWIRQRTGIATRRIARTESLTDMAAAAAGKALAAAALATADHAVRAGAARHALVVGADKMSDVTDWTDRSTCILLGDGAGAVIVSSAEGRDGIGPVVWGSDPTGGDAVRIYGGWRPYFRQDGRAVYRWATTA